MRTLLVALIFVLFGCTATPGDKIATGDTDCAPMSELRALYANNGFRTAALAPAQAAAFYEALTQDPDTPEAPFDFDAATLSQRRASERTVIEILDFSFHDCWVKGYRLNPDFALDILGQES